MSYFGIGISVLFDIILFNIHFNAMEIAGTSMCLLFTLMMTIYKTYFMKKEKEKIEAD